MPEIKHWLDYVEVFGALFMSLVQGAILVWIALQQHKYQKKNDLRIIYTAIQNELQELLDRALIGEFDDTTAQLARNAVKKSLGHTKDKKIKELSLKAFNLVTDLMVETKNNPENKESIQDKYKYKIIGLIFQIGEASSKYTAI